MDLLGLPTPKITSNAMTSIPFQRESSLLHHKTIYTVAILKEITEDTLEPKSIS
jgi:hypothetical protein